MRNKKMNSKVIVGIFGFLILASANVIAAEEEEKSPWKASAELGYVNASGNTNAESIKAAIDISYEIEKWLHSAHADALSVKNETTDSTGAVRDERIAAKWFASLKSDYKFNDFDYFYGLVSYEDDRFNGFQYQAKLGLGYGRRVIHTDAHELKLEIGPGYRTLKLEQLPPPEGPIDTSSQDENLLRLNGNYVWTISKTSKFMQTVTAENGEDQEEWKSVTELQADISSILAMKLSHEVKYLDKVAPGVEHYDRLTGVTLVFSF
jgi:putative salt-induced outer membrane protein